MFGRSELDRLTRHRSERTRAITAENPEGAVSSGGQESSPLGVGRKGRPCISLPAGSTESLMDVEGPGTIRHIWMTVPNETEHGASVLRDLVLRMYWDDESEPSVEVPLGDFFANGHGQRCDVDSLPIVVCPSGGMNSFWSMPFRDRARITIENEHDGEVDALFYQIDYALLDSLPADTAYFHAQWRRSNPNIAGTDHVILDDVTGSGHYVGTYLAWTALGEYWWGEGEVKCYLDGDEEFPTICGTGTEDYVGGAWCFSRPDATGYAEAETYSTAYLGYPFYQSEDGIPPRHGLYRFHVPDPIVFDESIRVTIQAIGHDGRGLFERTDDIASVGYWYQSEPHGPFPELDGPQARRPR